MSRAYLILENGTYFEGESFGAQKETTGELVFTTAMTGYLETLTDPSYFGQVVIQTFPLIGNYGVIPADFESASPSLKAYIVRNWCQAPSNFRCEGDLDTFLKAPIFPGFTISTPARSPELCASTEL
jgi:carbamoyl-phosphate synthase small subunit